MTKNLIKVFFAILIIIGFDSCHSNASNSAIDRDTASRSSDTTMIPGTPGPSGSEPGPGDTTKSHRDSLKRAVNISDSAGGIKP